MEIYLQDLVQFNLCVNASNIQELRLRRESLLDKFDKFEEEPAGSAAGMLQRVMSDMGGSSGVRSIILIDKDQDITLPRYALDMLDLSDCYAVN